MTTTPQSHASTANTPSQVDRMDYPSPHNPLPELAPVLKQLRLSGILESIDRRNREAIEHKMTYPEFLSLVIQDEAARRDQKKYGVSANKSGSLAFKPSLRTYSTA